MPDSQVRIDCEKHFDARVLIRAMAERMQNARSLADLRWDGHLFEAHARKEGLWLDPLSGKEHVNVS